MEGKERASAALEYARFKALDSDFVAIAHRAQRSPLLLEAVGRLRRAVEGGELLPIVLALAVELLPGAAQLLRVELREEAPKLEG